MTQKRTKTSERVAALAVVALGLWAAVERFAYLDRSPLPVGVDGYWYAARTRAVLETGFLDAATMPVVPYLCAALALIAGPIVAVKLVAAATALAQALALQLLIVRRTERPWAGVIASAIVVTSPGSAYMSAEFVQQGLGMAALLLFMAAIAKPREAGSATDTRGVVAALVLCALTHKLAAALAVTGAILWWALGASTSKRRRAGLGLAAAIAVGLVIAVVARGEPRALLSPTLDWTTAPIVFAPGVYWAYGWEVAAGAGAAAATLVLGVRGSLELRAVDLLACALALFIALPIIDNHDVLGVGFRLRIAAFVCLAPLVGLLAASLPEPRARGATIALVTAGLCLLRSPRPFEGVVWADERTASAMQRLPGLLPEDAIVVCPDRQLAYMSAWYSRAPTHLAPPPAADTDDIIHLLPRWRLDAGLLTALAHADDLLPAELARPIDLDPDRPWSLVLVSDNSLRWLGLSRVSRADEAGEDRQ